MPAKSIVADENVHFAIITHLRGKGYTVLSILEDYSGIDDESVISLAQQKSAILLTEDSDFGEWVFAHHIDNICVIFLRYHHTEVTAITDQLTNLLQNQTYTFENSFFVLTPKKLRYRQI